MDIAALDACTRALVKRGAREAYGISSSVDLTAEEIEGLRLAGELAESARAGLGSCR